MVKSIKKIVCPQCGSNKVQEQKDDYYFCESCCTKFFLDTDDVTITHKVDVVKPIASGGEKEWHALKKYVIGFVGVVIAIVVLYQVFSSFKQEGKPKPIPIQETPQKELVEEKKDVGQNKVSLSKGELIPLSDGKIISVQYGIVTKKDFHKLYVVLTDVLTNEIVSQKYVDFDLSLMTNGFRRKGFNLIRTNDNDLYLLISEKYLLWFNPSTLEFNYLDEVYFSKHKEFRDGIYQMVYDDSTESFEVKLNTGKEYVYFQRIDKVYTTDNFYEVFRTKLPNGKLIKTYDFERWSEEGSKLMQYTYLHQVGYPMNRLSYPWQNGRLKSTKDFTPQMLYMEGVMVGHDQEGLIILRKYTIDPEETYTLQKIALKDKSLLWSKKTEWNKVKSAFQIKELFFIELNQRFFLILNGEGKEIAKFDEYGLRKEIAL
ncbi:MAG: hypothetical protein LBE34_16545 [Flavobacteriaceae bacterium]|jgi:hypothetical protein|nr:hypothetical protein [Flavobacteriaceae bacterium]